MEESNYGGAYPSWVVEPHQKQKKKGQQELKVLGERTRVRNDVFRSTNGEKRESNSFTVSERNYDPTWFNKPKDKYMTKTRVKT